MPGNDIIETKSDGPEIEFPLPCLELWPQDTSEITPSMEAQLSGLKLLPGEGPIGLGPCVGGWIALTNYRLLVWLSDGGGNEEKLAHQQPQKIPVYMIWKLDQIELVGLTIITKNGFTFRCKFSNSSLRFHWYSILTKAYNIPQKIEHLFAFRYYSHLSAGLPKGGAKCPMLSLPCDSKVYNVSDEFERMGFDKSVWQISDVNQKFTLCSTYPQLHIIPKEISDDKMKKVAEFRGANRFPSVVWRSPVTGAVLVRCSQPSVGIMLWRSDEDEQFMSAVLDCCAKNPGQETREESSAPLRLLIVDARNYHAAQLNRLKGGGFEFADYYTRADISFMGLPNIHTVRDSFEKLITLLATKPDINNWHTAVEKTTWLHNLSHLLRSSHEVARALHVHARPVMVHCSDGWDRTPQLTSLSQLLMDPYYRTIQGFRVLVQREWLDFGHKFGDRCGHGVASDSINERCPVFLQWLDCVHQIRLQYPTAFQFNDTFLVKLGIHVYSTLFGTFLCNSLAERQQNRVAERTCSVWSYLNPETNWRITNFVYKESNEVLRPKWQHADLSLWEALYTRSLFTHHVTSYPSLIGHSPSVGSLTNHRRTLSDVALSSSADSSTGDLESHVQHPCIEMPMAGSIPVADPSGPPRHGAIKISTHRGTSVQSAVSDSDYEYRSSFTESDTDGKPAVREAGDKRSEMEDRPTFQLDSEDVIERSQDLNNDWLPAASDQKCALANRNGGDNGETQPVLTNRVSLGDPWCNNDTERMCSSTDTLTDATMNRSAGSNVSLSQTCVPKLSTSCQCVIAQHLSQLQSSSGEQLPVCESLNNGTNHAQMTCPNLPLYVVTTNGNTNGHEKTILEELIDNREALSDLANEENASDDSADDSSSCNSLTDVDSWWNTSYFRPLANSLPKNLRESFQSNQGRRWSHGHQDVDGLAVLEDAETAVIHSTKAQYRREQAQLKREVKRARKKVDTLLQYTNANQSLSSIQTEDAEHLSSSCSSGFTIAPVSRLSVGSSHSNPDSCSYDQISLTETQLPGWEPDHRAPRCSWCHVEFSFLIRRHHCRSCGGIFCDTCSSKRIPVHEKIIKTPVRVCKECFAKYSNQSMNKSSP